MGRSQNLIFTRAVSRVPQKDVSNSEREWEGVSLITIVPKSMRLEIETFDLPTLPPRHQPQGATCLPWQQGPALVGEEMNVNVEIFAYK